MRIRWFRPISRRTFQHPLQLLSVGSSSPSRLVSVAVPDRPIGRNSLRFALWLINTRRVSSETHLQPWAMQQPIRGSAYCNRQVAEIPLKRVQDRGGFFLGDQIAVRHRLLELRFVGVISRLIRLFLLGYWGCAWFIPRSCHGAGTRTSDSQPMCRPLTHSCLNKRTGLILKKLLGASQKSRSSDSE